MNIFGQIGFYSILTFVAVVVLRPLALHWIQELIKAGVDEAMKRRLATLQLDLDKDLERHRTELAVAAEHIRSSLARSTSDFSIYAQRRHDAIAGLFADVLRAEMLANDRSNLRDPENAQDAREDMSARVIRARNDAYEAYYRHALYLPEELDELAVAARDSFHDLLVEYVAPNDSPNVSRGSARKNIRTQLLHFQTKARSELSQSRPTMNFAEDGRMASTRLVAS
jgi:hypothetical protein